MGSAEHADSKDSPSQILGHPCIEMCMLYLCLSTGQSIRPNTPWRIFHGASRGHDGCAHPLHCADNAWHDRGVGRVLRTDGVRGLGKFDAETDPESGTSLFVGAAQSAVVSGRYGRDTSLTAPASYWLLDGGNGSTSAYAPAVALHGDSALIAWSDVTLGMIARELSLPGGQAGEPWVIPTDTDNFYQQVAAARAGDR